LRQKRKAYPTSWRKEVVDAVNQLMLLLDDVNERQFSSTNPIVEGEGKRAMSKMKSKAAIEKMAKENVKKNLPDRKKKKEFSQRKIAKHV